MAGPVVAEQGTDWIKLEQHGGQRGHEQDCGAVDIDQGKQ